MGGAQNRGAANVGISGSHSRGKLLWAAGCNGVGYFWRGRDIFQGETNMVVSLVVLPVKQQEFKVFGRDVGDRMTAVAQREGYGGGFAPTAETE